MKISPRRNAGASLLLGLFVIVIVTLFLGLLASFVARCSNLRPRTLPAEETNTVGSAHFSWTDPRAILVPVQSSSPPEGPPTAPNQFYAVVSFPWAEGMSNRYAAILRTEDWQTWVMLQNVRYGEITFTNIDTNVWAQLPFSDDEAPSNRAFYKGIILEE